MSEIKEQTFSIPYDVIEDAIIRWLVEGGELNKDDDILLVDIDAELDDADGISVSIEWVKNHTKKGILDDSDAEV